ncbi:adenylate/guanylate cyclase domain-containing protein, partial [Priestia sp. SIMBA_032]
MTTRLRLISGLVLLAFVLGHLLNHVAGLISVEAMNALLFLSIAPWRAWPGTVLLVAAAATHVAL